MRQSTCGTLEEVPVPRKMNSIGLAHDLTKSVEDDAITCQRWTKNTARLYFLIFSIGGTLEPETPVNSDN